MDKLFTNLLNLLKDFFYWLVNSVIEILSNLMTGLASLLPDYNIDFPTIDTSGFVHFYSWLNWFLPVDTAIVIVNAFAFSTILYFTVGCLTRWAKLTN